MFKSIVINICVAIYYQIHRIKGDLTCQNACEPKWPPIDTLEKNRGAYVFLQQKYYDR
jgi:predicted lipoprotein with Yx(FWY)xxD motif